MSDIRYRQQDSQEVSILVFVELALDVYHLPANTRSQASVSILVFVELALDDIQEGGRI